MKLSYGLILFCLLGLYGVANAGGNHHHEPSIVYVDVPIEVPVETPVYIDVQGETIINNTVIESSDAVLGFAASQCDITQSHFQTQWCIGGANYQNNSAIVFGLGQRFSNTAIKVTIGFKDGEVEFKDAAIGFGASGKF